MRSPLSASPRLALNIFIFVLCPLVTAQAQFRAGVQGSITDAHRAAVVGAIVTLINNETNKTQQSTSSEEGFYRFDRLAPGEYMIVVEHAGFKKAVLEKVEVKAEEAQGINVELTVGEITDTVTVSAELTEQLNTENANIAKAITKQEVLGLPQYGRDPYELVRLAPGVFGLGARICCGLSLGIVSAYYPSGSHQSVFSGENQPPVSANGQRPSANSYEVDGISVNSQVFGGSATLTPNQESVKEVRVATASYSAENGGATGALIQVVSQNGTNDFHGSAFYKDNDPGLNAYSKWGGPYGDRPPRDPNRYRQLGGSFGGPMYLPRLGENGPGLWSGKNKLFFFFSYETLRRHNKSYANYWAETPEYRELLRQQRPGSIAATIVSAPGMEPRILNVIPRDCASMGLNDPATCTTLAGGLDLGSPTGGMGQFIGDPLGGGLDGVPDVQFVQTFFESVNKSQQVNGRFDYQVRSNDLVAFSFYSTPVDAKAPQDFRPSLDFISAQRSVAGAVLWNHTHSTALNEARFNVIRFTDDGLTSNPDALWGIPNVQVNQFPFGSFNFGLSSPLVQYRTSYAFRDVVSKVVGSHGLKFGGELSREQNNDALTSARPSYIGGNLWSFANDAPLLELGTFDPRTGIPTDARKYLRSNRYAVFLQEDWKVRPNLTLNLGLRWEYFSPLREKFGNLSNLLFGTGERMLTDARLETRRSLYKPDRNNFGPQVGFAWSPKTFVGLEMGDKLVLRGGFGVSYNRIPRQIVDVRRNPPFFGGYTVLTGNQIIYTLGPSLTSPSGWPANPNTVQQFDPVTNLPLNGGYLFATLQDVPNPYSYHYSLDVQYGLPGKWVASVGYQGSASHKLTRFADPRIMVPSNPVVGVSLTMTDGNSNFNAMLAQLTHRFSNGFNFNAQYRWSKSIDTCSDELFCGAQTYPLDQRTERGPSDFDVKHYFVASVLWDIPMLNKKRGTMGKALGGWQLSSIVTASSGFPWTPVFSNRCVTLTGRQAFLCALRPAAYLGGLKQETSNQAFMRRSGTFGTDGSRYFTAPPSGQLDYLPPPGIGRNVFRGPHYFAVDMSLVKRIRLHRENTGVDLRANFFNVFNNLNLAPFFIFSPSTMVNDPNFGRATQSLSGRVIELQARLSF